MALLKEADFSNTCIKNTELSVISVLRFNGKHDDFLSAVFR